MSADRSEGVKGVWEQDHFSNEGPVTEELHRQALKHWTDPTGTRGPSVRKE